MDIKVGTSGWSFYDKENLFYPETLKSKDRLAFYSKNFKTVEVNSTFYHFPRESTIEKWFLESEEDFKFIIKINKYFTHLRKLIIDEESIKRLNEFLNSIEGLKHKLGGLLIQIPPSFKIDLNTLDLFLETLKNEQKLDYEIFLEVREESWIVDDFFNILNSHRVNLVYNNSSNKWPNVLKLTGDTLYIRLHGLEKLYYSSYSNEDLEKLLKEILLVNDSAYVFFNNTASKSGIENALYMKSII